ncbi:MAG: type II toxin-antitoxin system ParD family antitoxin [Alphaproteobacteria bacterium]|nr:type II toxin-antitoxin system ParD family antitoxin [Alphaproteobacteria bacterium]
MSKDRFALPDEPSQSQARDAKLAALRAALKDGEESGIAEAFDIDAFIAELHAEADAVEVAHNDPPTPWAAHKPPPS